MKHKIKHGGRSLFAVKWDIATCVIKKSARPPPPPLVTLSVHSDLVITEAGGERRDGVVVRCLMMNGVIHRRADSLSGFTSCSSL